MKTRLVLAAICLLIAIPAVADEPPLEDAFLDRLAGTWLMQGTIAGGDVTHDVVAEWVLGHQYLRLHEVAREKAPDGKPAYEAIVFIGWNEPSGVYACLWLDSTGGGGLNTPVVIGHAKRAGDELPFVFDMSDGGIFHNTFVYDKDSDTWGMLMDAVDGDTRRPFARVTLTRQ